MSHELINSTRAAEPVGPYPHARRVGNLLFLSGIGSRTRGTPEKRGEIPGVKLDKNGKVESYDIVAQCKSCFENVRLVLEDSGAKWENIVDVIVFLTSMDDFPAYNKIYADHFAGAGKPNPTRTTVEVSRLPTDICIELKVIATI